MSNARYRHYEQPRATQSTVPTRIPAQPDESVRTVPGLSAPRPPAFEAPTSAEVLASCKALLFEIVENARMLFAHGDDNPALIKNGMNACRQLIAIERIEQRERDRVQREALEAKRDAEKAAKEAAKAEATVPNLSEATQAQGTVPASNASVRIVPEAGEADITLLPTAAAPPELVRAAG